MGMMTIRGIPEEVHSALKARAKRHNRSTEAEVRAILQEAACPEDRLKMGDALAALGRQLRLSKEDLETVEQMHDKTPANPMRFE